ncbi:MAG: helix-turn-helix transcriptional regulator [Spirochaetes bacterium]|nr:helix-turn-helix transcriptional regulator [Spirochaetota bacterium]
MNRKNVKILMLQHDIKIPELARELEVTPSSIYYVLTGRMTSQRIQKKLEEKFGMSIEEIISAWNTIPSPKHAGHGGQRQAVAV